MTTYAPIVSTETDPDAPGTSSLWKRWSNNVLAMFEGATGAPRLMDLAHPTFAAGSVDMANVFGSGVQSTVQYTSGGGGFTFGAEQYRFRAMKAGGLRASAIIWIGSGPLISVYMKVYKNAVLQGTVTSTAGTAGAAQTIDFSFAAGDVIGLAIGGDGSGTGTAITNVKDLKVQGDQRGVFQI